jgi:two-component system response regulator RegA
LAFRPGQPSRASKRRISPDEEEGMSLNLEIGTGAADIERRGPAGTQVRSLLVVDPDRLLVNRLKQGFEARNYGVQTLETVSEALKAIAFRAPDCLVVEARLADGSGLDLVEALSNIRPDAKAIVLTGYGNIANAVAAIKRGATDYLAKPTDIETLHAALAGHSTGAAPAFDKPMSADRVRWEHIQRIFEQCDHNVSETARRLDMHRRTLQRILAKRAPR